MKISRKLKNKIRYMRTIKFGMILISILILKHSSGQLRTQDRMDNCLQAVYKDKKKSKKSDRCGRVSIAFFQNFSDTITLYLNNIAIYRSYIFHDSSVVSSNFTDSITSIRLSNQIQDSITIVYENQNKYLKFPVNEKYILYTIHSYSNGNCYVSARRKKSLSIK